MKNSFSRLLFPTLLITVLLFTVCADAQQKADIIITNGKLVTLDSNVISQAIAISKNKILATGSNADMQHYTGKKTRTIDAGGRTIVPGLFDSHLHVIRAGRFYNAELRWDAVPTLALALQMLREQSERTPPGQWVRVVGGWNEFQFAEKRLPTMEEINEATGETPAFVLYLYGKAFINKAGLRKLNITKDSPNPPGGLIEKDIHGNPTGILIAEPNAFILYSTLAKLPELTVEEKINSTLQFVSELNSLGVTAAMDAGGGFQNYPDDYTITDSLFNKAFLNIRIPHFLFSQTKGRELQDYQRWVGFVDIHPELNNSQDHIDYYVAGAGENLLSDAADFENFLFPRPELSSAMEKGLFDIISLLVKKRWPFRLHATYNESITRDLDVIEAVNKLTPINGLTWFIDHAETISFENLLRIKNLGGGIAIQHRMAYQGELFVRRYGAHAAATAPPVRRMIELGIPLALGTDGTRVASYNPWVALQWLVTGKTVGGTQTLSPENTVDRLTALSLFTHGGYNLIHERFNGRLKPGYLADLAILDKDYLTIPETAIGSVHSLLTITNGKIVYGDRTVFDLAPPELPVIPQWSPVKFYSRHFKSNVISH